MGALLVSLEGISGSGKTYLASKLQAQLESAKTGLLSEITDRRSVAHSGLEQGILGTLKQSGDVFFRGGFPRTETLLLLALKAHDYERSIGPELAAGKVIIEDRSIDTIAVYQAIILSGADTAMRMEIAQHIFKFACSWRKAPDITFLIEDEFELCIRRAQDRDGGRVYSPDELELLRAAASLYAEYAEVNAPRIMRIDRTNSSLEASLDAMVARIMRIGACDA